MSRIVKHPLPVWRPPYCVVVMQRAEPAVFVEAEPLTVQIPRLVFDPELWAMAISPMPAMADADVLVGSTQMP